MQNYILYQAYGSPGHINECRFSLLRYLSVYNLQPPADTAIAIYTDEPAQFESFSSYFPLFEMREITKREIDKWRGEHGFTHRVKIKMLHDFFSRYEGNVLYCDTDTYIVQPLGPLFDRIQNGAAVMHEYEGIIDKEATPSLHKWDTFLRDKTFMYNGKQLTFFNHMKMWNAGVIGLNDNKKHIVEDVLALTDVIYKQFRKHITEQFAFSYCLQQNGEVISASDYIVHYWNLKEFRLLLNTFFQKNEEESIPNLIKLSAPLDTVSMQQQKEHYQQLPLLKKLLLTMTGKNWSIRRYQHKI